MENLKSEVIESKIDTLKIKQKKGKAKIASLIGMIVGSLWIAVWSGLKFVGLLPTYVAVSEIIYSGLTIGAVFSPVTFSILLDKAKDIRLEKK